MVNCDRITITPPTITNKVRTPEVLKALGVVFRNKCYLCEKSDLSPDCFEIDHFIPVNENPLLEMDWNNLYLCCNNCNKSRSKSTPSGGLLDPCHTNHDVENEIKYSFALHKYDIPIFSPTSNSPTVIVLNTIEQLNLMHFGNAITKTKCESLRHVIWREATELLSYICSLKRAIEQQELNNIAEYERLIQFKIDASSSFTMLMRSIYNKFM